MMFESDDDFEDDEIIDERGSLNPGELSFQAFGELLKQSGKITFLMDVVLDEDGDPIFENGHVVTAPAFIFYADNSFGFVF